MVRLFKLIVLQDIALSPFLSRLLGQEALETAHVHLRPHHMPGMARETVREEASSSSPTLEMSQQKHRSLWMQ